jgi:hypothetical protein
VAPFVDQLVARQPKVLLRKVDIDRKDSDAARMAAQQFGMRSIPFFCIYDAKGILVGKVQEPDLGAVEFGIQKALAGGT